jgi:hypothetical protein
MKICAKFSRLKWCFALIVVLLVALVIACSFSNRWFHSAGKHDTSGIWDPTMEAYIGFYRTYHSDSDDKDVKEYIERLFSLWVYSESDFSKYCSAFPAMSESMAVEFEKQINSSDVLGFDRFRPIKIHISDGRIDLLSSGVDREIWIASYPSSEAMPGYGIDSYDALCSRFVDVLKRTTKEPETPK